MELIQTDSHLIFQTIQQSATSLWCSRHTGEFSLHPTWDLATQQNPQCFGAIWGLVGKLKLHPDLEDRLVVIKDCEKICDLQDINTKDSEAAHAAYRIKAVSIIPISAVRETVPSPQLKPCPKHHIGVLSHQVTEEENCPEVQKKFKKIGGIFKQGRDTLKSTAGNAAQGIANQVKVPWKRDELGSKELEKLERRLEDEFYKLFNGRESFYFSFTGDLSNTLQRQYAQENPKDPLWKRVDQRFFFNISMVQEIIDLSDSRANDWILPLIQGFIGIEVCMLEPEESAPPFLPDSQLPNYFQLMIISRRSRNRAGTRYKRRGVDQNGHVANYVETEQIVRYYNYSLGFVQVRGSVPVFWSQPGIKYRPPPIINRTPKENQEAFAKHFENQIGLYDTVTCISLVERMGREKKIADAYLENVLAFNQPKISYISFDFHEHCRGMRFEKVSILLDSIREMINKMGYYWQDSHGKVCSQNGVFRVNCIDCLDRTNVVQTAIARQVLQIQLTKLGVIEPESGLSSSCKSIFQTLWANNGDIISRQYAGTNALKGDYTRTGERNLSGLMKDGMNSASRYYVNNIKDTYRQAAIDVMLGNSISEDLLHTDTTGDVTDGADDAGTNAEHVRVVIDDCKKLLVQNVDEIVGSWGLIDGENDSGLPLQDEMDIVLLLTRDCYYCARYDADTDTIVNYQQIPLSSITKIEFGVFDHAINLPIFQNKPEGENYLRIVYKINDSDGYQHLFRSTKLRFFNNMAVPIRTNEERVESLKVIADTIAVTMEVSGFPPDLWFGKLEKRKSKPVDVKNILSSLLLAAEQPKSPRKERQNLNNMPPPPAVVVDTKFASYLPPSEPPPLDRQSSQTSGDIFFPSCGVLFNKDDQQMGQQMNKQKLHLKKEHANSSSTSNLENITGHLSQISLLNDVGKLMGPSMGLIKKTTALIPEMAEMAEKAVSMTSLNVDANPSSLAFSCPSINGLEPKHSTHETKDLHLSKEPKEVFDCQSVILNI